MKDRDGNEWRMVPVNATVEMLAAAFNAPITGHPETGGISFGDAYKEMVAAAPQFVAGEVTKEMCWNVFEDCDGCEKNMAETARHWLDRWRKELGPALGLVTREEMARSVEIRDTEIARLETDLELARRDAERYRWLRDSDNEGPISAGNATAFGKYGFERVEWFYGDELDAAVDEARAGNGGGV